MNRRQIIKSAAGLGLFTSLWLSRSSYSKDLSQQTNSECIDLVGLFDQFFIDAKGFDMGVPKTPLLSAFVVFDPQCPDSIQFWKLANQFSDRVRFTWLPVAILNSRSELQGALILSASNPAEMMMRQVNQYEAPTRGLATADLRISGSARDDVWSNSRIFRRAGGKNVPYVLYQDRQNKTKGSAQVNTVELLGKFLNLS